MGDVIWGAGVFGVGWRWRRGWERGQCGRGRRGDVYEWCVEVVGEEDGEEGGDVPSKLVPGRWWVSCCGMEIHLGLVPSRLDVPRVCWDRKRGDWEMRGEIQGSGWEGGFEYWD